MQEFKKHVFPRFYNPVRPFPSYFLVDIVVDDIFKIVVRISDNNNY